MASYLGNSPDVILQVRKRNFRYVATSNQTIFSGNDSNSLSLNINTSDVEVFLNGVLLDQTDYTITATQLTLSAGAATDDIIEVITNTAFASADQYSKEEVDNKVSVAISDLVGTAGAALNTLGELSDALADDANFASTVTTALGTKASTTYVNDQIAAIQVTPTQVSDKANASTGYFDLPVGTTAQRPSTPDTGQTRFNTTLGKLEIYQNGVFAQYDPIYSADTLVVGGGGGGGRGSNAGGGGGAGGYQSSSISLVIGSQYAIIVGSGGAGSSGDASGVSGGNSSLGSVLTSIGGGGGGGNAANGVSGGSGGGGGSAGNSVFYLGGSGTSGQGSNGGRGQHVPGAYEGGGGGGGPGGNGADANGNTGGAGGAGFNWQSLGTFYAGGGGGGGNGPGAGGNGGGGTGGTVTITATAGTANSGGGGGGAMLNGPASAAGGSGIVIIRYAGSTRGTGGTITSSGGYTYHTFTSSGTYTA